MIFFIAWEGRWHFAIPPLHETSWVQKFHTGDKSLPRSGEYFWMVVAWGKFAPSNQKHNPDLGSNTSWVWNFYSCSPDVIHRKPVMVSLMSAVSMAIIFIAFWLVAYKRADCLLCVSSPFHYCSAVSRFSRSQS